MTNQAKAGIFKPKTLLSTSLIDWSLTKPTRVKDALTTPSWKQATDEEYIALVKNQTWHLVPPSSDLNVIGSKWIFRIKRNSYGTIQRYKARLIANGFHQNLGVDFFLVVKATTI
ncbi:uncharacterized mitochondrial protein AtMg00820-like [Cucumis melo]|uniref:Uncharacterized mitochondrial protein AtMg00820-like n=1 Tax=Cucumis melo TaxID=3656 RepID=A0ABM3KLJ7_CUCME|nr:uncharacterized mitochondrial protein AtMg00820-like [Cucumis melo]